MSNTNFHDTASELPSYAAHGSSQVFNASTPPPPLPPLPPPKPSGSTEIDSFNGPAQGPALPPTPSGAQYAFNRGSIAQQEQQQQPLDRPASLAQQTPDPGDRWLPKILEDKSKQDLIDALSKPDLLAALAHSRQTVHASTTESQTALEKALAENMNLAAHLNEVEEQLKQSRAATQTQLLSAHALERQWKQKESEMDRALAPFAPSSLYQRLSQGVQEQEMICRALEESFLDGDGSLASEREVSEWIRRYREAKRVYYSRFERKQRWDEGRVGGWR